MFPMGAFGQCLLACSFTAIVLTFVQFASALLFKMVRRSNSSTPEELSKVLKMYLPNGIGDKYLQANPEDVAIAYEQIIDADAVSKAHTKLDHQCCAEDLPDCWKF